MWDMVIIHEFMSHASVGRLHGVEVGGVLGSDVVAARCPSRLPASRARSYAEVAAVACGDESVMHAHARNSVVTGGLLPVQKSTSYDLAGCREGPTCRKRVKGGF